MKTKRMLSFLLCMLLLLSTGTAFVHAEEAVSQPETYEEQLDRYYAACDRKTGEILEQYDTQINGKNDDDYIALATSLSMEKTDRVKAMNWIVEIYDLAEPDEQTYLRNYMLQCAEYTEEDNLKEFCATRLKTPFVMPRSAFNRDAAVSYARSYWNGRGPDYPRLMFTGDCANFASQCLHAGGVPMQGDWYIHRKNYNHDYPATKKEMNDSWTLSSPSPWISAIEFNDFWKSRVTTFECSRDEYLAQHNSIYHKDILYGDAIQLMKPHLWYFRGYHTMIVVGYDDSFEDFRYAAHTENRYGMSLYTVLCETEYEKWNVKFFHFV